MHRKYEMRAILLLTVSRLFAINTVQRRNSEVKTTPSCHGRRGAGGIWTVHNAGGQEAGRWGCARPFAVRPTTMALGRTGSVPSNRRLPRTCESFGSGVTCHGEARATGTRSRASMKAASQASPPSVLRSASREAPCTSAPARWAGAGGAAVRRGAGLGRLRRAARRQVAGARRARASRGAMRGWTSGGAWARDGRFCAVFTERWSGNWRRSRSGWRCVRIARPPRPSARHALSVRWCGPSRS